jgi:cytochrome c peroxidase
MRLLLAAAVAIPLGLDLYLPAPDSNPLTSANIELGRRLFFDRRLSRDGSIACSSCHDPARGFRWPRVNDRRGRSVGRDAAMRRT